MIVDNKCSRCGKHLKIKGFTDVNTATCVHCNKEHTITKKAKRKSLLLYMLVTLAATFVFALIQVLFRINFIFLLIIIFVSVMAFSILINYLMVKLRWLEYEAK